MKYLVVILLIVSTAAEAKRRTYNPFSVDYEHRTARMARQQGAPRVMYNGGYVAPYQYGTGTTINTTVNIGR